MVVVVPTMAWPCCWHHEETAPPESSSHHENANTFAAADDATLITSASDVIMTVFVLCYDTIVATLSRPTKRTCPSPP
jgi:hypothetical protein